MKWVLDIDRSLQDGSLQTALQDGNVPDALKYQCVVV